MNKADASPSPRSSPLKGEEVVVYLGLGSNLGDREANLRQGLELLGRRIAGMRTSSAYETEPWGYTVQPKFLNMVCQGETDLPPGALLAFCKQVEAEVGRTPTFRYGPRTLDVDILDYGGVTLSTPELELPHPRMAERAFVLVPLAELAPDWRHPTLGKTAAELLAAATGKEGVRLWGESASIGHRA